MVRCHCETTREFDESILIIFSYMYHVRIMPKPQHKHKKSDAQGLAAFPFCVLLFTTNPINANSKKERCVVRENFTLIICVLLIIM